MRMTCAKCGHLNLRASGDPTEACPHCGAIYSKAAARPRSAGGGTEPEGAAYLDGYLQRLRGATLYPSFRASTRITFVVLVALALVFLLVGLVALLHREWASGLGAIGGAAMVAGAALVGKDLSLMLADLSDAAVRTAWAAERNGDR